MLHGVGCKLGCDAWGCVEQLAVAMIVKGESVFTLHAHLQEIRKRCSTLLFLEADLLARNKRHTETGLPSITQHQRICGAWWRWLRGADAQPCPATPGIRRKMQSLYSIERISRCQARPCLHLAKASSGAELLTLSVLHRRQIYRPR